MGERAQVYGIRQRTKVTDKGYAPQVYGHKFTASPPPIQIQHKVLEF